VDGVALVDGSLARVAAVVGDGPAALAVNVHHHREQLRTHLGGRVQLSVEDAEPLGTAGALGHLRDWIDGRPVVVVNGDTWCPAPLGPLLDGWDGERIRVLVAGSSVMGDRARVAGALLPWRDVAELRPEPSGLWEASWRAALAAGRVNAVRAAPPFVDCGTPAAYLAANMAASGRAPVVGEGAVVEGELVRSVVWPGAVVRAGEVLVDAIRTEAGLTVLIR
jgi:mannose-1-phosphate guanylyltransferase/MurNAc alpha-1-phosphate uridylyltransferase